MSALTRIVGAGVALALASLVVATEGCGRSVLVGDDEEVGFGGIGGGAGSAGSKGGGGGSGGFGGFGGSSGSSGSPSGGSAGSGGSCSCPGCCDPAGICRPGTDVNACGIGSVWCIDCGALGFGCINGACEGPAPPCGPGTCSGCCDAQGLCRFGTESDACGVAGQLCTDCAAIGAGCVNGICQGPPPLCGPGNCGGCCNSAGVCQAGNLDGACGHAGAPCESCIVSGKVCTQPGNYCAFFPSCGPATCPSGCCDASGKCRDGKNDLACGTNGQTCKDCAASGQSCAPAGFCYSGPHCGPDNCSGCCTANGTCVSGGSSSECGLFGALCDNCEAKGQTCIGQVCSSGSLCPAAYAGCSPDALTPPPLASTSCSSAELDALEQACQGAPPGPNCGQYFQSLLGSNPKCYDCLLQFSSDAAYARCLAPFLTASCNHDLTCALFCSNESCAQCPPGQEEFCQDKVFGSNGACQSWVNGYFCAQAAISGPGAFCEFGNDVGQWIAQVGAHYCGK